MTPPDLSGFGDWQVMRPLEGGNRHAVWLVQSAEQWAVAKSTTRSPAALEWVQRLAPLVRRVGLGVPGYLPAQDGALCAGGWLLEPYIPGAPCPPAQLPTLAEPLARFRALAGDVTQRPGFAASLDLLCHDAGGDIDLTTLPADLTAALRAAWRPFLGQAQAPVHGDLGPGNVLLPPEGRPVLTDWDEARLDLPLYDTVPLTPAPPQAQARAALAWEIAICWQHEPERARQLATPFLRNGADAGPIPPENAQMSHSGTNTQQKKRNKPPHDRKFALFAVDAPFRPS